jgi:hypothetical protein
VRIYFPTGQQNVFAEARRLNFDPKACPTCAEPPFNDITINMASHPEWVPGALITRLRLDVCTGGRAGTDDDRVLMDYVRPAARQ